MWKEPMFGTTKLTLELRDLVDNGVNIWDFEYPSYYKGEEKAKFEQKVIDHFYFRQIGQETVGRFLHYFRTKVQEIMPYYLQVYKSVEIMNAIEDPFGNVDIVETFEQTREGSSSGSATSSSSTNASSENSEDLTHKFSNTPQGQIDNIDNYLTEGSKDKSETHSEVTSSGSGTNTSDSESSETVTHTFTKKGNQGVNTYAHDIIEFRKSFINVDMMIIEDLNELFLKVY